MIYVKEILRITRVIANSVQQMTSLKSNKIQLKCDEKRPDGNLDQHFINFQMGNGAFRGIWQLCTVGQNGVLVEI